MRCSQAADSIQDYISGELSGEDRSSLETHLSHCEACRSCAEGMMALRSRLRDLFKATAPSGLRSRVLDMASGDGE